MQKQNGVGLLNNYAIFETDEFLKQFGKLDTQMQRYLTKKLNEYVYPQLRSEPMYGKNIKKLRGYVPNTWRYRIGKYRVFYMLDMEEKIVFLLSVEQRKDAY